MPKPQEHYLKGVEFVANKQLTDAAREFNSALEQEPNNTEFLYSQAVTLMNLRRLTEARIVIDKAIHLNKTDWDFYFVSGLIYFAEKSFTLAESELLKAEEMNPNSTLLYESHGRLLIKQHNYSRAIEYFDKVLAADSDNHRCHYYKDLALTHLKKWTEATKSLDLPLNISPYDDATIKIQNFCQTQLSGDLSHDTDVSI